ncbi:hypothetical protein K32_50000 [Kaistia sp. 32K]|uniref:hypothetical protein n=1 Tax=Kaistia sp. 32K TaxID=2795690 RepID=UPI0019165988|nr:hypothetical protein [Kaistia sp. 32K]BCP56383.1 hypothetical protein K32_50000 [Kaistia sp. 32K]
MSTPQTPQTPQKRPNDNDKPGGNSSFGNTHRPPDVQGDHPENQAEPRDPARQQGDEPDKAGTTRYDAPPR